MATTSHIATTPALKEWAVVVHALLAGEQIVDLRKGGLREDGRHFDLPARRFWLYPTTEHQRPELLRDAYRHWPELAVSAPIGQSIPVLGYAEVTDIALITEPEDVAALDGKTIWTADYASTRLKWKARDPLWVLLLRVHRLIEPITVPWNDAYGGCTSWVTLAGLPEDPTTVASEPAMSEAAFDSRRKGTREALPAPRWET